MFRKIVVLLVLCLSCTICAAADETESEMAAQTQETSVPDGTEEENSDVQVFLADIGAAVNDRLALSNSYTEAELSMMTNDEIAQANQECCESERWFMDRYRDAKFESRNLQYLCGQYLTGLQNQYDAYDSWQENHDIDAYNELWEAGFAKRASAVVELKQFYGVGFTDISDMEEKVKELEKLDELGSGTVSEETTRKVQECLNTLKFPVGSVDGYCGYRTVQMIRRFQKLYGYGPADGVIDDELVAQLEEEVQKAAPAEEETEAESEMQTEETAAPEAPAEQGEPETGSETENETEKETEKVRLG